MISDILQFRRAEQAPVTHPVRLPSRPRAAAVRSKAPVVTAAAPDAPFESSGPLETGRSNTIPLIPRDVAHLPTQRWHWSARRRMAQDHPFGRIGQMEANLESLVAELETEVDRLVARSELLLDGHQSR